MAPIAVGFVKSTSKGPQVDPAVGQFGRQTAAVIITGDRANGERRMASCYLPSEANF